MVFLGRTNTGLQVALRDLGNSRIRMELLGRNMVTRREHPWLWWNPFSFQAQDGGWCLNSRRKWKVFASSCFDSSVRLVGRGLDFCGCFCGYKLRQF
jgi:hypothetical protein